MKLLPKNPFETSGVMKGNSVYGMFFFINPDEMQHIVVSNEDDIVRMLYWMSQTAFTSSWKHSVQRLPSNTLRPLSPNPLLKGNSPSAGIDSKQFTQNQGVTCHIVVRDRYIRGFIGSIMGDALEQTSWDYDQEICSFIDRNPGRDVKVRPRGARRNLERDVEDI